MKVLTIEGFGGERGGQGYIYEGEAWLFRFTVSSPETFFRLQLPYAIKSLQIDSRQIYEVTLYSKPGIGLSNVYLYVSFESKPKRSQVNALRNAPPADFEPNDLFSSLETRLKELSPAAKQLLLKSLRKQGGDRK
jgi:hypothetical protein